MVEFGEQVQFTYVMGGLAREFDPAPEEAAARLRHWLDAAGESGMPVDPRLWFEGPISSSYPVCLAVKAAAEQSDDAGARYLRRVRQGLMCFRRKLDNTEALVEEARAAGLDVERFRIDLGSHAVVEAFGADLELGRELPPDVPESDTRCSAGGVERLPFPTLRFDGEDGETRWVFGTQPLEAYRAAAVAAGAETAGTDAPSVLEALKRFGWMAAVEVEAVCELAALQVQGELWRLAADRRAKPQRVLTGWLWEPA